KEKKMIQNKNDAQKNPNFALANLLITGLLIEGSTLIFSTNKPETIDATAMGTSTQMGSQFGIKLNIYDYSTPADKQILVEAFQKGEDKGLVNALSKMKAAGHIEVTGTLGYDCSYIQMIPTPTGRKIRFVTNRPLRFGEVYWDTRSTAYNLTAGEFDLNAPGRRQLCFCWDCVSHSELIPLVSTRADPASNEAGGLNYEWQPMSTASVKTPSPEPSHSVLVQRTVEACELAREAAAIAAEGIATGSMSRLNDIRQCEKELDAIDMEVDSGVTSTITRVPEAETRQLLACMKVMIGLERIGDLLLSF